MSNKDNAAGIAIGGIFLSALFIFGFAKKAEAAVEEEPGFLDDIDLEGLPEAIERPDEEFQAVIPYLPLLTPVIN